MKEANNTNDIKLDSSTIPVDTVVDEKSPFVLTFCSGKGGVGKSVLAVNFGILLSKFAKVLIWDTNIQFPNVHLMLGVEPPVRLNDVYANKIDATQAIFSINDNLSILSGSPALIDGNKFIDNKVYIAVEQILSKTNYDYIIIDSPAGYSEDIFQCCNISDMVMLTMTDEPTSMLDAYGLVKILKTKIDLRKMKLLVNNVIDDEDAEEVVEKFNLVTDKFLNMHIPSMGFVPYDRAVRQSILMQEALVSTKPNSEATQAIEEISDKISEYYNLLLNNSKV